MTRVDLDLRFIPALAGSNRWLPFMIMQVIAYLRTTLTWYCNGCRTEQKSCMKHTCSRCLCAMHVCKTCIAITSASNLSQITCTQCAQPLIVAHIPLRLKRT